MEELRKIITRENILGAISILAFVLSASSWAHTFITQRKRIDISIIHYYRTKEVHIFYFLFDNCSRLPVSITKLAVSTNNNKFVQCAQISKKVADRTRTIGSEVVERSKTMSLQYPVTLASLGGASGYVVFEDAESILQERPTAWIFQVYTNRGKALKKILPFVDSIRPAELL